MRLPVAGSGTRDCAPEADKISRRSVWDERLGAESGMRDCAPEVDEVSGCAGWEIIHRKGRM